MSGASSPTYALVGHATPSDLEGGARHARSTKRSDRGWLSIAAGALLCVGLGAAVTLAGVRTAGYAPPAHPAGRPGSMLVTRDSRPVDCEAEPCLNQGQPPIPRYQFDLEQHKAFVGGRNLGRQVAFMPQKLGGGVTVMDLETGRTLASLWYSNYGDYGAIPHHIIAFPSKNPYNEFEIINSCQGGKNTHLYNLDNVDPDPPQATNIYRLRFDGNTLMIAENVSDSTGLGLGVHTTINPKDAESYAVSDGQKDIFAIFDRRTTRVIAAYRFDWEGNTPHDLKTNWRKGGKMIITRIHPDKKTGKFDLLGSKGNKIDVELAPMAEGKLEDGEIPGVACEKVVAADGFVYHPSGLFGAEIIRMLGGAVVHNLTDPDCAPITFVSFNSDTPDHAPVRRVGRNVWEVTVGSVGSPGHELGWTPDGKRFLMMNNLRENSVGLFDTASPNPLDWRKLGVVRDPLWKGAYPNPFHMGFSHDSKKGYFVVLRPPPQRSNLMVVDMEDFHIIKEIQGITQDMQSLATTMDGKYLLIITGGFQRFASGLFVVDMETDEPLGFFPAPGGHHDMGVVPRTVADMKFTRAVSM